MAAGAGDDHVAIVDDSSAEGDYKLIGDPIPFFKPNVGVVTEEQDLKQIINEGGSDAATSVTWTLCCGLTGIGLCYVYCNSKLIDQGQYGFCNVNGRVTLMTPGWHLLSSPTTSFIEAVDVKENKICVGPVSIIRVPQGSVAFAFNDGKPEVLLPGRHARKTASFQYSATYSLADELIVFGTIKFLTVRSGGVRVCYEKGKVCVLVPGRYVINSPSFTISTLILTQQQNLRFSKHPVMLDGGINLLVEGLLTFKVEDVEKLIHELGDNDLRRAVEDVTKAELSRVFATVHLEQLVTAISPDKKDAASVLGQPAGGGGGGGDDDIRHHICRQVVHGVLPLSNHWGIRIINFQIESTKFADEKYAAEYEESSLSIAKAKATQRATVINNEISVLSARAAAATLQIQAEGRKVAAVLDAEASAESRRIEAKSRNDAAKMMRDEFAKDYAIAGLQVDFAKSLRATSLTVHAESDVGRILMSQPSLAGPHPEAMR